MCTTPTMPASPLCSQITLHLSLWCHLNISWNQLFTCPGIMGLPWWLDSKDSACNAGDLGSIPGSRRSPGEGNGDPLQYSCLENSMDREAWWATVHRDLKESDTTEWWTLYISPDQTLSFIYVFFNVICMPAAKLLQLCPTLCDPIDGNLIQCKSWVGCI